MENDKEYKKLAAALIDRENRESEIVSNAMKALAKKEAEQQRTEQKDNLNANYDSEYEKLESERREREKDEIYQDLATQVFNNDDWWIGAYQD